MRKLTDWVRSLLTGADFHLAPWEPGDWSTDSPPSPAEKHAATIARLGYKVKGAAHDKHHRH